MKYDEYLQTDYWKAVSTKVKERAGYKCQVCNSPHDLQAHHRTYDNRGRELDHLDDLICMCRRCHGVFHGKIEVAPPPAPRPAPKPKASQQPKHLTLDDMVPVTYSNHRRLLSQKEMWHWMKNRGFEPTKSGWAKRMIGQLVPRHFFKGGKC